MSQRLLRNDDLLKLSFVGDPQISPCKDTVAYVLTEMSKKKDDYYSSLHLVNLKGESQQLTYHYSDSRVVKDLAPRWSPEGKHVTFLSNRNGTNQVWIISLEKEGEAAPLTNVPGNIIEHVWSSNGTQLALTVEEEPEVVSQSDVKVITRLRYKSDGISEFLEKRKHIYLFDMKTKEATKVTEGEFDFYKPCFSPDGLKLLYLGSKDEDQELEYVPSIWEYDLTTNLESLFHKGEGTIRTIQYSGDGKWVAFIGHDKGEHYSYSMNVWVISTDTKRIKNISKQLDRPVDNVVRVDAQYDTGEQRIFWDTSSKHLYFTAMDKGNVYLFKTNLQGEVSSPLSEGEHTITSFDMLDDETAILVDAHAHSTGDIVMQNVNDIEKRQQLTYWNNDLFNEIKLSVPEHIRFTSVNDLEIEGWLLKPTGTEEREKSPLVLQIHGGPHSSYGYGFQFEWQLLAAKGYTVLYLNPRGSQGYGQEFAQKVIGDWCGKDFEDLSNGLDYVLENYPFINEDQLFVTGESYGGYMTNMITARTNRFKAAITQNSVTNLYSMFGTSDIGFYFNSWQLDNADMWEDEEKVMKFSPIRYARNVKTPMLILHNEKDYRCPIEQAEQWYLALRRLGVDTKLIRFPNENHHLTSRGKPSHRLERLEHIIGWFEQYRS